MEIRYLELVKDPPIDFVADKHVSSRKWKRDPFAKSNLFFALEAARVDK